MKTILIIYVISQLVTTAYGLAVIESVKPFVEKQLRDKGYHRNKNSLYNFNNTLSNILKGFIPFYYFAKAIKIVMNKTDVIEDNVNEQIENKLYVKEDEVEDEDITVIEDPTPNIVNNMKVAFEKPEVYKARKNNFTSLYDTYETPIDYITRESTPTDNLEINPFVNEEKEVEQVVVKEKVTNKDIAEAICDLNPDELSMLSEKILKLEKFKRRSNSLKLEKDVA